MNQLSVQPTQTESLIDIGVFSPFVQHPSSLLIPKMSYFLKPLFALTEISIRDLTCRGTVTSLFLQNSLFVALKNKVSQCRTRHSARNKLPSKM